MYVLIGLDPGDEPEPVAVVQTWDRFTRSWVTRLVDRDGHQVGDAAYDGTRADAAASRRYMEASLPANETEA